MKDQNFLDIAKDKGHSIVDLGNQYNKQVMKVLEQDSQFLLKHNIMDYSLLLGVQETTNQRVSSDMYQQYDINT